MKFNPFATTSSLVRIVLGAAVTLTALASIAARADERQNGGDLIRQYFALGISRAYEMTVPATGATLDMGDVFPAALKKQMTPETLRQWFDQQKHVLLREIARLEVTDVGFDYYVLPEYRDSCAFTYRSSRPLVYISLDNCAESVVSVDDAAAILIGEAIHHMLVIKPWTPKNEDFAVAWLAGVIRQTEATDSQP